jgi:hypothetical protein
MDASKHLLPPENGRRILLLKRNREVAAVGRVSWRGGGVECGAERGEEEGEKEEVRAHRDGAENEEIKKAVSVKSRRHLVLQFVFRRRCSFRSRHL